MARILSSGQIKFLQGELIRLGFGSPAMVADGEWGGETAAAIHRALVATGMAPMLDEVTERALRESHGIDLRPIPV